MKLAVLDLCVWLPEYQWDQDRFGDIVANWLRQELPEADMEVIQIVEGAELPAPHAYDGYILSGSDKGVYDDTPWMGPLRSFLQEARDHRSPLLGICFGHQIMADVFGGKAEKVGPPEVGVRTFDMEGTSVGAHVWHQDQVTRMPPGASVIAAAPYCPVAGLSYDFPALSVQFHPEYTADYVATFLRRSRGKVLSEAETDQAMEQLDASTVVPDLFAARAAAFFREALAEKA
ncbi:type 1 glutamine amidotransferase [Marimonas sp. MJW-29]|uniref:Type 1 glutamine amidotransferase n=1 Tax=Sulfitobacter sediminis TaxID=3234186 RepID=A0ABV3RTP5_9RHOB